MAFFVEGHYGDPGAFQPGSQGARTQKAIDCGFVTGGFLGKSQIDGEALGTADFQVFDELYDPQRSLPNPTCREGWKLSICGSQGGPLQFNAVPL
jgi:hypothetical protein